MFSNQTKIFSLVSILKSFYKVLHGGKSPDMQILKVFTALGSPVALLAKHQQSFKEDTDSEVISVDEIDIHKRKTQIFFVQGIISSCFLPSCVKQFY